MRNKIKQLILSGLLMFSVYTLNGQIKENYTGEWEFKAPDAPEGSTEGNITLKTNEVIMTFDDLVAFPSAWVQVRNDSIIYQMEFDMATVLFSLKIVDKDIISGKAVWKNGETAIILRKKIVGVRV